MNITQDVLQSMLHYDPCSGIFTWKESRKGSNGVGSRAGSEYPNGYRYIGMYGKAILEHRLAFLYMTGEVPPEIDHKDRIPSNNAWSNLRPATRSQNNQNTKSKTAGRGVLRGAHWRKDKNAWASEIRANGKRKKLGYFKTAEEAHAAYVDAAKKLHGEFAVVL